MRNLLTVGGSKPKITKGFSTPNFEAGPRRILQRKLGGSVPDCNRGQAPAPLLQSSRSSGHITPRHATPRHAIAYKKRTALLGQKSCIYTRRTWRRYAGVTLTATTWLLACLIKRPVYPDRVCDLHICHYASGSNSLCRSFKYVGR